MFKKYNIKYSSSIKWVNRIISTKKSHKQFITIGVETGVQNGRMVNAITLIIYASK